jgi:DNA-binding transcriptional regulator YiaG
VKWNNEAFSYTLPAGAAATFTWSGTQTGGSGAPVGSTIWLQATNNNNYVSARADQTNTPLNASATQVQAWEEFDVVDAGNGLIALRSHANNDYVSARIDQTNEPLDASATQVQAWEEFQWLPQSNGTVSLQAVANNDYVSARTDQTNTPLDASVTQAQGWEQFRWGQV